MKKQIGLIAMVALMSVNAEAAKPHFTYGNPGVIFKVAGYPAAGEKRNAFIVELEDKECEFYKHCYNPSFIHISGENGLALDYVYRSFKRKGVDALRLSAGVAAFDDNEGAVYHIGASFELFSTESVSGMITFDSYDDKKLIGFGFRF